MEKIAIFLPRHTILEHAKRVLEQEQIHVQMVKVVENTNAVEEAQIAVEAGVRVIIARGLQATLIKENISIPVVEMPMTVQEMGLIIRKAKGQLKKDCPSIALIAFSNMFTGLDHLEELFDFKLHFYELNQLEDTRLYVNRAIADGVDLIIGGVKSNQVAFEIGFPSLFFETGEDSIRDALGMATRMLQLSAMEKHHEAQLETLLDTSFSGIIKINAYQEVVAINRMIEQLLGKDASEVVGFPIGQIISGMDTEGIKAMLDGESEMYSTTIYIGNQMLMIVGAPIQYDGHFSGAILTCHKIKTSDRPDHKTVQEKLTGGYLARRGFEDILRESVEVKRCVQLARAYAISKSPVLILGEAGTEKEILAEAIHNNSTQKGGPFININCGSLSPQEQKEIIFGIDMEDGVRKNRKSGLELATYGTLLLQEIHHLSYQSQYLLYKAIHDGQVWRGGSMVRQILAVRVIVATEVKLSLLVKRGEFREDLYYLLTALKMELPPLRGHGQDIVQLASRYIDRFNGRYTRYVTVSQDAYEAMKSYDWQGNLIQLEMFCQRLVLTAQRRRVEIGMVENLLQELYPQIREVEENTQTIVLKHPEAMKIAQLLERHQGNRVLVAHAMDISTTTLWRKMKKYGIGRKYEM